MKPRFFALLGTVAAFAACARNESTIASDPRIEITPATRIGDRDGPGMVVGFSSLACDSRRNYYQVDIRRADIAVFDSSGRYVRTIGRTGSGPGEFQQPLPIILDHDTAFVVDRSNARYTVFAPSDSVVRTIPLGMIGGENPYSTVLLPTRELVVNGLRFEQADSSFALHLVSEDGSSVRSFGERTYAPTERSLTTPPWRRVLAPARDGGFWAAHAFEYRIDKWSGGGVLERSLVVDSAWFPPSRPSRETSERPSAPSGPIIAAIQEGDNGLWVSIIDRQPADSTTTSSRRGDTTREDPYRDTTIELLDIQTGTVVARGRADARMQHFACANTLFSSGEDRDGNPYLQLWRLELRR